MAASQRVPTHPDALRLACLGAAALLRARNDGEPETVLGPGKPLALIAYLHIAPGRTATREHLVDLLWADLEPDAARHALRQTIWLLRQKLGSAAVATQNGDVTLCVPLDCDRADFLAALDRFDLEGAVSAYRGEFLPDFALPGGKEFEYWALAERTRLRLLFVRAAEKVARSRMRLGHARDARTLAQRVRDTDPLNETGWRLLLETLLAMGDRVSALVECERLEAMLRTEERAPEPATRVLLRTTRQEHDRAAPDGSHGLVAELVGREREFAEILDAWESVQRGHARHVHVGGAAGLGKTRLLNDVAARLRASGARLAHARANPGERDVPYAAAAEVAAALARLPGAAGVAPANAATLVALNPSLSSAFPAARADTTAADDALRSRTIALAELVAAVADEGPVALVVDDLHWADAPSIQTLIGAVERCASERLFCLTASRPAPRASQAVSAVAVELQPLEVEHVASLIASLGTLPDAPWASDLARQVHAASGGTPLLVLEALQLALDRDSLTLEGGRWQTPDPRRLADDLSQGSALRARIDALPRDDRWLLVLLAAAGTPLTVEMLARATGRDIESLTADLARLEHVGLAGRASDEWDAAHDEVAAAAWDTAAVDSRTAAHAAFGRTLLETDGAAGGAALLRACRHLALGHDEGRLAHAARRWLSRGYRRGERRGLRVLLGELLDADPESPVVRRVVARMPLHWRVGLTSRRRVASVAALGAVPLAAVAFALRAPEPPAFLLYYVPELEGQSQEALAVPVSRDLARSGGVLNLSDVKPIAREPFDGQGTVRQPGGRLRAAMILTEDGGQEVALLAPDGTARRLTFSPGDDGPGAWSPDGRYLVIPTDKWDERSHSDLAVTDLTDPARPRWRRLTLDAESRDVAPQWSPDGTRIAFHRLYYDDRPDEVCVISFDASRLRCLRPAGLTLWQLQSWASLGHVVVNGLDDEAVSVIALVDVESGAWTAQAWGHTGVAAPVGWITCVCRRERGERMRSRILSVTQPERDILLLPDDPPPYFWASGAGGMTAPYLDRLEVRAPAAALPRDGYARLEAIGRDQHGRDIAIAPLAWASLDTSVATIDSTGLLLARREGSVSVIATAGGWRADTMTLEIGPGDVTTVLLEKWEGDLIERWQPFGIPKPVIVAFGDGQRAFWHHGDSTFPSGAYSRSTLDARRGLGVDAVLSTPITDAQWQNIVMTLEPRDSVAYESWDHETGQPPLSGNWSRCTAGFPSGYGAPGSDHVALVAGLAKLAPAPHAADTGALWRLRMQIFPDGRCGIAVNGKAAAISDRSISMDRPVHLRIDGWSHRTQILVGQLEIWTGVKRDVDWSVVEGK